MFSPLSNSNQQCSPTWSYSVGMCAEHNAMDLHHYCHHNHCHHHTASTARHRYLSSHTWDDLQGKLCFEDSDRESHLKSHYPYSHWRHCRPESLQTNQTCFTAAKLRHKSAICLKSLSITRSYEAKICYICFSKQNHPNQTWFISQVIYHRHNLHHVFVALDWETVSWYCTSKRLTAPASDNWWIWQKFVPMPLYLPQYTSKLQDSLHHVWPDWEDLHKSSHSWYYITLHVILK